MVPAEGIEPPTFGLVHVWWSLRRGLKPNCKGKDVRDGRTSVGKAGYL
jgi:hypothetical protein